MRNVKREMKARARLARGLVNALQIDVDYVCTDVNNYDIICMEESIQECRTTVQQLVDNITELEYLLYLVKRERNTP